MTYTLDASMTRQPPPPRALDQRLTALQRANEIRTARARLKLDLRARRVTLTWLLHDPPDIIATMRVFDLIHATPKIGRTKANKMLATARVSPSKTIAGLTERQRRELIELAARR